MKNNSRRIVAQMRITTVARALLIGSLMLLMSCSGGEDSIPFLPPTPQPEQGAVISGVAAAGAPIIGSVTVRDAQGDTRTTPIGADGSYLINVDGMTPPFVFRAEGDVGGRRYVLHSAAVEADINGIINITPFTDLILASMAGQLASQYYNNGQFDNLTAEDLNTAQEELQSVLLPVLTAMGVSGSIDLLRTSFAADRTGLDAVLDVVKVTVDLDTKIALLTNLVNDQTVSLDIDTGTVVGTFDDTDLNTEVATELQAIAQMWANFTAFYAGGLPISSDVQFLDLFDADEFLFNGRNLETWLATEAQDVSMIGIGISGIALQQIDLRSGTAGVTFMETRNGHLDRGPSGVMQMLKKDGKWRFAGNGRIAVVGVRAAATYIADADTDSPQIITHLNILIKADQPAADLVLSAIVKGPGLPPEGLIFNEMIPNDTFFHNETFMTTYHFVDDESIDEIFDNAIYTFELYDEEDGAGVLLATYDDVLPRRPLKQVELSESSFPFITATSEAEWLAFSGGMLTVEWEMPAGMKSKSLNIALFGEDPSMDLIQIQENLLPAQLTTSLNIEISFTPAGRAMIIESLDQDHRAFQKMEFR